MQCNISPVVLLPINNSSTGKITNFVSIATETSRAMKEEEFLFWGDLVSARDRRALRQRLFSTFVDDDSTI